MDKQALVRKLNDEFALSLDVPSWQRVEGSLVVDLHSVLRDSPADDEFDVDIPEWFSSRSQKHSAIVDISSLSGISMDALASLQTVPLADLYQLVVVLHARSVEEIESEDETGFDSTSSLDAVSDEHEILIQKIHTFSDLEIENSISAAVLLSSFGLEDVYFALFEERDGKLIFREDLARPELWLLEAFNAAVFSAEHPILHWYSSGRLDQTLMEAFATYSSGELQKASSLVRMFLLRQVICPAGRFWMGNEDTDSVRHRVNISQSISVCVFLRSRMLCIDWSVKVTATKWHFILWSRNPGTRQFSFAMPYLN